MVVIISFLSYFASLESSVTIIKALWESSPEVG